ncbi:hypothetical protein WA158_005802 [Blastocystis sp. Blastoise]
MSEDLNKLPYSELLKEKKLEKKLKLLKWNIGEPHESTFVDNVFDIRETMKNVKQLISYLGETIQLYDEILNDENAKKAAPEHLALIDYSTDNRELHVYIEKRIFEGLRDIDNCLIYIETEAQSIRNPRELFKEMKRIRKEKYDECEKFVKYNISKNGIDTPPRTPTHEAKRTKIEPSQPERNLTPLIDFPMLNLDCISESEENSSSSDKE